VDVVGGSGDVVGHSGRTKDGDVATRNINKQHLLTVLKVLRTGSIW